MNLCGRIEISEDDVLTLEPPEEEPSMISRSRSFASSAESRTVVGGGSRVSKAARGRELAERVRALLAPPAAASWPPLCLQTLYSRFLSLWAELLLALWMAVSV